MSTSSPSTDATISETLHKGVSITLFLDESKQPPVFNGFQWKGDMNWGRTGSYVTSFYLIIAGIDNNILNKDFHGAVSVVLKLAQDLTQPPWKIDARHAQCLPRLIQDCKSNLEIPISQLTVQEQKSIVENLALRWLDIRVHVQLAFFESRSNASQQTLDRQQQAISFLNSLEQRLRNGDASDEDDSDELEDDEDHTTAVESETLNDGLKLAVTLDEQSGKFASFQYDGDILWSRRGRYTTSVFLLLHTLQKRIVGSSPSNALKGILDLAEDLNDGIDDEDVNLQYQLEALQKDLRLSIENAEGALSGEEAKRTVELFALRYLDIRVHLSYAFVEMDDVASEEELQRQKHAIEVLDRFEAQMAAAAANAAQTVGDGSNMNDEDEEEEGDE